MDPLTVVVAVRAARAVDDDSIEALGRLLARHEDLRLWRDDADPTGVRISTDCPADALDDALSLGRDLADEAVAVSPFDAAVEEVVAMDDERQLVWRAKP